MADINITDWGKYAPAKKSLFLRMLVKLGFSRGVVRKKILKAWRQQYGDIVDVTVRGINYRLNLSDNVIDRKIFASSAVYDQAELTHLINTANGNSARGGVFVDIGANSGYYTLTLAQNTDYKVLAIEPNPVTLDRLRYNVQINTNLKDRIVIIPTGVGKTGEFDLHIGDDLGSASLHKDLDSSANSVVKIKTRPLLDILASQGVMQIDILKIDIEGAEDIALAPFFETAEVKFLPTCFVIEDTHRRMWRVDLHDLMLRRGYKLTLRSGGNSIWHLDSRLLN